MRCQRLFVTMADRSDRHVGLGLAGMSLSLVCSSAILLRGMGQLRDGIQSAAETLVAPQGPADRAANAATSISYSIADWTAEMAVPWPMKLIPWRRWTPRPR